MSTMTSELASRKAFLIAAVEKEKLFFGPNFKRLPKAKLASIEKWTNYANQKPPRAPTRKFSDFLEAVEDCVSGICSFLIKMNDPVEKIHARFDNYDIPGLQDYWDEEAVPEVLRIAYANYVAVPPPDDTTSERSKKRQRTQLGDTSEQLSTADNRNLGHDGQERSYGDVYRLDVNAVQDALSTGKDVEPIFLTKPRNESDKSFVTLWISIEMSKRLAEKGQKMI